MKVVPVVKSTDIYWDAGGKNHFRVREAGTHAVALVAYNGISTMDASLNLDEFARYIKDCQRLMARKRRENRKSADASRKGEKVAMKAVVR